MSQLINAFWCNFFQIFSNNLKSVYLNIKYFITCLKMLLSKNFKCIPINALIEFLIYTDLFSKYLFNKAFGSFYPLTAGLSFLFGSKFSVAFVLITVYGKWYINFTSNIFCWLSNVKIISSSSIFWAMIQQVIMKLSHT